MFGVDDFGEVLLGAALLEALAAGEVRVAAACKHERAVAVRALRRLSVSMRLLVVDHVAELGSLDAALEAAEKLVGAASRLVDHVLLDEAHVARVIPIPVSNALFNHFLLRNGHRVLSLRLGRIDCSRLVLCRLRRVNFLEIARGLGAIVSGLGHLHDLIQQVALLRIQVNNGLGSDGSSRGRPHAHGSELGLLTN